MEIDAGMATVIVAVISGIMTIIVNALNLRNSNRSLILDVSRRLENHNELQDEKIAHMSELMNQKISALTDEVHKNNELKIRVPVLEEKVQHLEERVQELSHA